MHLALDFEAFAGRPLPPAPKAHYRGGGAIPAGEREGDAHCSHPVGTLGGSSGGYRFLACSRRLAACALCLWAQGASLE